MPGDAYIGLGPSRTISTQENNPRDMPHYQPDGDNFSTEAHFFFPRRL